MNGWDREWQNGVERVSALFLALPGEIRERLGALAASLVALKDEMQGLVAAVDASRHCADCGGACCARGKFHFGAADLLVYLAAGKPLFTPRFDNGRCPYLGDAGCLIPPGYRPFNCITFNCEVIEDQLSRDEVSRFYRMERELKEKYAALRALFPCKEADGALLRDAPASAPASAPSHSRF